MDYAKITTGNKEEFIQGSVILLTGLINTAIAQRGACLFGLSGGSTPRPVYEALGKSSQIDWSAVWVCLADERYVDINHNESNQRLVRETLLKEADIPNKNLLFPDTSLPIEECVLRYHIALFGKKLDVLTLGMGLDGHIASLFPPIPEEALDRNKHVIHTTTPSANSWQTDTFAVHDRISMTLPVLARAHSKVFLLQGDEKRNMWEKMIRDPRGKKYWPAKGVLRSGGVTVIY